MKVYILQEHVDNHCCCPETYIIGVYETEEKALSKFNEIVDNEILTNDFFMANDFDEPLTRETHYVDNDVVEFEEGSVELFCEGNGDYYTLTIIEEEVQ